MGLSHFYQSKNIIHKIVESDIQEQNGKSPTIINILMKEQLFKIVKRHRRFIIMMIWRNRSNREITFA